MKNFVFALLFLIVLVLIAAGTAIWYVQPTKPLDLAYTRVSISDKIIDMVQRRSFEVHLTEADLNNLVKMSLAARPQLPNDIRITGAQAAQDGDLMKVDINAIWRDSLPFTATLTYRMNYAEPNLLLHLESTRMKRYLLPSDWFKSPDITVNLYDNMPKLVGVKSIQFQPDGLLISLKLR